MRPCQLQSLRLLPKRVFVRSDIATDLLSSQLFEVDCNEPDLFVFPLRGDLGIVWKALMSATALLHHGAVSCNTWSPQDFRER